LEAAEEARQKKRLETIAEKKKALQEATKAQEAADKK